jgi:hypothetical protein
MAPTDPSAAIGVDNASDRSTATGPSVPIIPGRPDNALKPKPDLPDWVTKETKERKPNWENVPTFYKLEDIEDKLGNSSWSNDPDKMQMEVYFSRNPEVPGVPETFNIDNLIPVIVNLDRGHGHTYLLTVWGAPKGQEKHFLWNEFDGQLWRFKEKNFGKVVDMVVCDTFGGHMLERQYRAQTGSWGPI